MNNAQAWILHSCRVEDSLWLHLCPLNIRQKAVFWLRIFHHRHGRNLNRTSTIGAANWLPLQLRSATTPNEKKKNLQIFRNMCSPFFPALTPYVSERWKKHLYKYICINIYMPLFFDSNWPFKCTTTINPTVALQTMRRSLLPKCDTRRGTLGLDESRAEKGGQAAALFTKCQGEFVFLVGNVTDSDYFWWWKRCENAVALAVLCEFLRMTSFDKGMMDSSGVKDWKLQVVIGNLAVI